MYINYHRQFKKHLRKLPQKTQSQFKKRLLLFAEDQFHPTLNNHILKDPYKGCRSINITGDIRAIYTVENGRYIFLAIGSHSELYS